MKNHKEDWEVEWEKEWEEEWEKKRQEDSLEEDLQEEDLLDEDWLADEFQKESEEMDPQSEQSTVKELRRQQIDSAVLAFSALAAIIVLCIAWFANNTRVTGTGMQIASQGSRFELASWGNKRSYDSVESNGTIETIQETTYYETSGDKTSINWMLAGEKDNSLRPDSSGSLHFSVIPLAEDFQIDSLKVMLEIIPYKVKTEADNNSEETVTIQGTQYVPLDETKDRAIYDLLEGHLLFFSSFSEEDRYSGWLSSGTTPFPVASLPVNVPKINPADGQSRYDYTLHWIWPGYLSQITENGTGNLFSDSDSEDYQNMIRVINKSPEKFFAQYSSEDLPGDVSSDEISTVSFSKLMSYYNNGDEEIGETVRFIQLRLTAIEGE